MRTQCGKTQHRKGAEVLEFTLAFLPLVMMMFAVLDAAWGMYVKTTLMQAVRMGVRYGITITGTQASAAGSDMTTMVKSWVQSNSMGLLAGSSGLSKIKVNYFQPPAQGSTSPATDVSTQNNGNAPGNIMQVSIQGYNLGPLVNRIFGLRQAIDRSATPINAVAADIIEPCRDSPPIGSAP